MSAKTVLLVLCVLSLQKNLQSKAQEFDSISKVPVFKFPEETVECGVDFKKIESEIQVIKTNLLGNKYHVATGNTNNDEQVASDVQNLKKLINELSLRSGGDDLVDLIKSNNKFVNEKVLALTRGVSTLIEDFDLTNDETIDRHKRYNSSFKQINENINKISENFAENSLKLIQFSENNANTLKQFEEFNQNITKLLNTKFEQHEADVTKLKTQHEQFSAQLKQFNELLDKQATHMGEHLVIIKKNFAEKQEQSTFVEHFNTTLIEHLNKHVEGLNEHGNSLKDIKEEITKLDSQFGTECTKFDTNKEIIEQLVTRFDKAETVWAKIESLNEAKKNCETCGFPIDVIVID